MNSLLTGLEQKSIIDAEGVSRLKNHIARKYSSLPSARRAIILADALNKVFDARLPGFEDELGRKLRRQLITNAIKKSSFSINCLDVFQTAVELNESGDPFFHSLETWLAENSPEPVPRLQLVTLVQEAQKRIALCPDMGVARALEAAAGENRIGGQCENTSGINISAVSGADASGYEAQAETGDDAACAAALEDGAAGKMELTQAAEPQAGEGTAGDSLEHDAYDPAEPHLVLAQFSELFAKKRVTGGKGRRLLTAATLTAVLTISPFLTGLISAPDLPASSAAVFGQLNIPTSSGIVASSGATGTPTGTKARRHLKMKATAYDLSVQSCGKLPGEPGYGITKSGVKASVGRTVAVDPKVIPLGSRLQINFPAEYRQLDGVYIAEDTGNLIKGNAIDVFFGEDKKGSTRVFSSAMAFGVRTVEVTILDNSQN